MDEQTKKIIDDEITETIRLLMAKIDNLHAVMNKRFEGMKKVVADYLELQSQISMATIRANLKNI